MIKYCKSCLFPNTKPDIFFDNKVNVTKAIDLFIKNLKSFKKDINSKNNKSILKKLSQTKKVRSKIIKLKLKICEYLD